MVTSDTFQTSLWMSTAVLPPETKTLTEPLDTQVVVVGAGFTGLSAALHLRELGCEVVVLEAKEIGFGASGRNGGQVISGLKIDPHALVKKFGNETASQIFCATERSADLVFNSNNISAGIVDLSPVGENLPDSLISQMRSLKVPKFTEPGKLPEWGFIFSPYVCFIRPVDCLEEKLFLVRSLVAIVRTVTANVCIPALPPIEATIGIKNANTTICSIVAPNKLIHQVAKKAVNRFSRSQLNLLLVLVITPSVISSSPTPANLKASSSASSCNTVKTSSLIIIPTSLLFLSTTAAEFKL